MASISHKRFYLASNLRIVFVQELELNNKPVSCHKHLNDNLWPHFTAFKNALFLRKTTLLKWIRTYVCSLEIDRWQDYLTISSYKLYKNTQINRRFGLFVTGEKVLLDRGSNPGPFADRANTLPLSYRTTQSYHQPIITLTLPGYTLHRTLYISPRISYIFPRRT